jgi:hypothetical protein
MTRVNMAVNDECNITVMWQTLTLEKDVITVVYSGRVLKYYLQEPVS